MTPDTGLLCPPGDARRSRRCDRVAARRRAAARGARRGGAAGGDREVLLGRHRAAADLGLRAGAGGLMRTALAHPLTRVTLVMLAAAGVIVLLWWRGPNTHTIAHAFSRVEWKWVLVAIGFNLLSVVARALAWKTVIDVAMPAPRPRLPARLLGLLGRPVRERGPAGPRRRARARRRADAPDARAEGSLGHARRHGLRAPRLRPRAGGDPGRVRRVLREDPGLGGDEPDRRRRRRRRALHLRVRERAPPPRRRGSRGSAPCAAWSRWAATGSA